MKKLATLILALSAVIYSHAQVFNTANTLKPLKFSVGIEPGVYYDDFALFLHGGMGIKSGIDLGMKYGILDGHDYFGADIEWRLLNSKVDISLTTGVHNWYVMGVDLGLNFSFPVKSDILIYTGLDMDIDFADDAVARLWIPLGVEIKMRSYFSLIIEAEIPVSDPAFAIIGGGVLFYF